MKSFKEIISIKSLNEARDVMRFLKKNKHLNDEERELINKFFITNNKANGKFIEAFGNWGSKYHNNMKWEDFQQFMLDYRSGFKLLMSKFKPPGKKGEDYWPIRLKQKGFIANIPLTQKEAQYFNNCNYGFLHVNYCIGWNESVSYWAHYVINERKVPIYVVNGVGKWVVMILDDNKNYEVWDKFNNEDKAMYDAEPIPGFSIKKNLLGRNMSKLYDEAREIILADSIDPADIKKSINSIADDVYYYADEYYREITEYYNELQNAVDNIEKYLYDRQDRYIEYADKLRKETIHLADIIDNMSTDFELTEYHGQLYTKVELTGFITKMQNDLQDVEEELDEINDAVEYWENKKEYFTELPGSDSDAYYFEEDLNKHIYDWMPDIDIPDYFPDPTYYDVDSNTEELFIQLVPYREELDNELREYIDSMSYAGPPSKNDIIGILESNQFY
jgi:hypothetical protein